MNSLKRKFFTLVLALAMVTTLVPSLAPAYADDAQSDMQIVEGETDTLDAEQSLAEPEELFDGYLKMKVYGSSSRKKAGYRLKGPNRYLYDYLNTEINKIAKGERGTTIFEIKAEDLFADRDFWLASDLGLRTLTDVDGNVTETARPRIQDFGLVLDALMADNPYAMYWFDKTAGVSYQEFDYHIEDGNLGEMLFMSGTAVINMPVAKGYAVGEGESYVVDTALGHATETVVDKAQSIIDKYADSSTEDKLRGYADEICALVSYNHSAAAGNADNGDPWQLIWVFDGKEDTNVVCEGYAKAFKFLCDLTEFSGSVDCITVTGDLNGGGHMWNIVTPDDGYNYLVDVTNNDAGSKMGDRNIFMCKEPAGGTYPSYRFGSPGDTLTYTYDSDCRSIYSKNELLIPGDGTGHIPAEEPVDEEVQVKSLSFEFGDLSFYENFDGAYAGDKFIPGVGWEYCESDHFIYNFYHNYAFLEGNKITVNGKTYTCNTDGDFVSADGTVLPGEVRISWDQWEQPWTVENQGHVNIEYKDGSCTATVKIEKSPIKSFSLVFAKEQVLYGGEDTLEFTEPVYDPETGEYKDVTWNWYTFGDAMTRNWGKGDYILVDGVRYDCQLHPTNNTGWFKSKSGKVIPETDIFIISGQSAETPWGDGMHEATAYLKYKGKVAASCKLKVRVVEELVKSIRFEPSSAFRVIKNNGDPYFSFMPGDKFIINYNDSRGEVAYTARYVVTHNGYELFFRDSKGKVPEQGEIYLNELVDRIDKSWGAGVHPFYISYFGKECEFNAMLIDKWKDQPKVISIIKDLPSVKITKAVAGKKSATVKWKKVSTKNRKKFEKIQIQYSTDKKFKKNVKTVYAKKTAVSRKISKLKGKKTYYFRIRAYTNDGDIKRVSAWSKVMKAKIKR